MDAIDIKKYTEERERLRGQYRERVGKREIDETKNWQYRKSEMKMIFHTNS